MDRERLGRAMAPGFDDRGPEGQAGIKVGLHSFDLDHWLVVGAIQSFWLSPDCFRGENSSPWE